MEPKINATLTNSPGYWWWQVRSLNSWAAEPPESSLNPAQVFVKSLHRLAGFIATDGDNGDNGTSAAVLQRGDGVWLGTAVQDDRWWLSDVAEQQLSDVAEQQSSEKFLKKI